MALFCGVFFMDVISTAPRHNIDDSLKCSGVKGSHAACRKERKMTKMLNLEYTCGKQKKSAGNGHEWLFLGKYWGHNT